MKIIELLEHVNRNLSTIAANQSMLYCKLQSIERCLKASEKDKTDKEK